MVIRGIRTPGHLTHDVIASIVVFLVAVPLSLGIAQASNAPIYAGIIGAIAGGIAVGLIGGAPLQVSGPAAGLTVIVAGIVAQLGEWRLVCLVSVLAGILQVIFGLVKIARVSMAISPAVVHGMLAGIGITISISQLQVWLGGSPAKTGGVIGNLKQVPGLVSNLNMASLAVGAATFGTLLLWPKLPKSVQKVPGPLAAVLIGTAVSFLSPFTDVSRLKLDGSLLDNIQLPILPSADMWGAVIGATLTIALVASVESLLCAVATDKLHAGPRANLDRELIGQGVGNIASGMLGGLPVTGVIVRTSANLATGAKTNVSSILHGVWVLLFVLVATPLLIKIPLAALAGLLVHVGIRLVNVNHMRELSKFADLPIYIITILGIVFKDLLFGVFLGLGVSLLVLLFRMSRVEVHSEEEGDHYRVRVDGSLTFLSVPKVMAALEKVPDDKNVEIHLHTDFMDHGAFETLHGWEKQRERLNLNVSIIEHHDDFYMLASDDQPKKRRTKPSAIAQTPSAPTQP